MGRNNNLPLGRNEKTLILREGRVDGCMYVSESP